MMRRTLWLAGIALSTSVYVAASGSQGAWLLKVPEKDRLRINPLAQDAPTVAAGALIFAQHCASCHGNEAEGIGHHPSLRTTRVHEASDGELQWLLRNGSLAHGMPAWSGLPEAQRWQVIRYLHSLPLEDHAR
jgi:mono/diheme cytochrome c family protein